MTDESNNNPFGMVPFCRICFENDTVDSLIAPCLCKGGSMFVHRRCLNKWIQINPNISTKYRCMVCSVCFHLRPKFTSFLIMYPGPFLYTIISLGGETSLIFSIDLFLNSMGIETEMSLFFSVLSMVLCMIFFYLFLWSWFTRSIIYSDSLVTLTKRHLISMSIPATALIVVNALLPCGTYRLPYCAYVHVAFAFFLICHFILSLFLQALKKRIGVFNVPVNLIRNHPSHLHHIPQILPPV